LGGWFFKEIHNSRVFFNRIGEDFVKKSWSNCERGVLLGGGTSWVKGGRVVSLMGLMKHHRLQTDSEDRFFHLIDCEEGEKSYPVPVKKSGSISWVVSVWLKRAVGENIKGKPKESN